MKSFKDRVVNAYAMNLAAEGQKLIDIAYRNAEFENRTYNLHDSYGSCVYFNGKEYPNTRRYVGRKALVGKKNPQGDLVLGRADVDEFFDSYRPSTKGFHLVAVAAIYYAEILEKGLGNLRRKYRVISGMDSAINDLSRKYKGVVRNINM